MSKRARFLKHRGILKLLIIAVLLLVYFFQEKTEQVGPGHSSLVSVLTVHDGDTLSVFIDGKKQRVRLFAIDSPELAQSYGQQSKRDLEKLVQGQRFRIEHSEKDRYKRPIVRMFFEDQRELNAVLIEQGAAYWYRRYAPKRRDLARLEEQARKARRGLWANPPKLKPWKFREQNRLRAEKGHK